MQIENFNAAKKYIICLCIALSFSIIVFAQHSECIPFEMSKIDGFEKIGDSTIRFRDSLLYDSIQVLLRDEVYQNDDEHSVIKFKSLKGNQILIANSKPDGSWSDYFTITYAPPHFNDKYLSIKDSAFSCNRNLMLGITKRQLDDYLMKISDCILESKEATIYKYYWFDYYSLDYEFYNMPCYVASFIFKKNRLVKFGFGLYKAEIDEDFFPPKYKVVKKQRVLLQ